MIFKMTTLLLGFQVLLIIFSQCSAGNTTKVSSGNRVSNFHQRFSQLPTLQATKSIPGLEHLLGVMGPLALAAMVSLPFVAPAAAALLPLASITGVFGRRRRNLENSLRRVPISDAEDLMRRIHAAARRADVL